MLLHLQTGADCHADVPDHADILEHADGVLAVLFHVAHQKLLSVDSLCLWVQVSGCVYAKTFQCVSV